MEHQIIMDNHIIMEHCITVEYPFIIEDHIIVNITIMEHLEIMEHSIIMDPRDPFSVTINSIMRLTGLFDVPIHVRLYNTQKFKHQQTVSNHVSLRKMRRLT